MVFGVLSCGCSLICVLILVWGLKKVGFFGLGVVGGWPALSCLEKEWVSGEDEDGEGDGKRKDFGKKRKQRSDEWVRDKNTKKLFTVTVYLHGYKLQ